MNKNINLCEILKGCEGQKFYTTIFGIATLLEIRDSHIVFLSSTGKSTFLLSSKGKYGLYDEGECVVFPSKDQRDWSKWVKPISIPVDTPIMVKTNNDGWVLRYYKGFNKDLGHTVFMYQCKSTDLGEDGDSIGYKYMIPFDKFNPNNIKESLKYNIQK